VGERVVAAEVWREETDRRVGVVPFKQSVELPDPARSRHPRIATPVFSHPLPISHVLKHHTALPRASA
jgi:hypothetical protein